METLHTVKTRNLVSSLLASLAMDFKLHLVQSPVSPQKYRFKSQGNASYSENTQFSQFLARFVSNGFQIAPCSISSFYLAVLPWKSPTWWTQMIMMTSLGFALAQFRLISYSLTLLSIDHLLREQLCVSVVFLTLLRLKWSERLSPINASPGLQIFNRRPWRLLDNLQHLKNKCEADILKRA